jgi:hypothetical protein
VKGWLAQAAVVAAALAAFVALLQLLRGLGAWVRGDDAPSAGTPRPDLGLEDQRRRILQHLREIDFDRATGKLDEADYQALRARYEAEAVRVLDALRAADGAGGTP